MSPDRRRRALALAGVAALFAALAPVASAAPARTLSFRDDLGRSITLALPVRRAIVFNSFTTEFIRAVAGMGVVVGVDQGVVREHAYWPTVTPSMLAGDDQATPNYEAIVALRPDVVFFPRNGDWIKASRVLAPFHIPVVVITGWDALKQEENVSLIGGIFEQPARAARLNAFYRHYKDLLAQRLKGVKRRRVYLEQTAGPNYSPIPGSGWHDMIQEAGGDNIFGDVRFGDQSATRGSVHAFPVDPEQILARKPELIVKLEPMQYQPVTQAAAVRMLQSIAARPGYATLPAVQSGQVYYLSNYMGNASSKIIGALQIAKWLYPARFADVDPSAAMRTWLETFQGVRYPGSDWVSLAQIRQPATGTAR